MNRTWKVAAGAACAALVLTAAKRFRAGAARAVEEIERYRQALGDGNPAELWEARGRGASGRRQRGPKGASLEKCDLGLGPGVVKGAYAQLPRYFADVDKVMDLESRLVHCRVTLQGITPEEARKNPFGGPGRKTDNDALVAFITAESRGVKMNVPTTHPKEVEAFEVGKKIFFHRGGPYDFACSTCHAVDNIRIRLQDLPNLTKQADAQQRLHVVARLPRVAGRGAHVPVAPRGLLPPAALPAPGVHFRGLGGADHVPREERQRRPVQRAVHQALKGETHMKIKFIALSAVAALVAGCATTPSDEESTPRPSPS